jgi:hypothetical protein
MAMDNIQKLVLGVLGIAGAIAMLTPTDVDFAAKMANAPPAEGIPAPAPPVTYPVDEAEFTEEAIESDEEEVADDEEDVAFGQPLVDDSTQGSSQNQPNPDQSWDANNQANLNYNYDYGQGTAQNFNTGSGMAPVSAPSPDITFPSTGQ